MRNEREVAEALIKCSQVKQRGDFASAKAILQKTHFPDMFGMVVANQVDGLAAKYKEYDFSNLSNILPCIPEHKTLIRYVQLHNSNPHKMLGALVMLGAKAELDDLRYEVITNKLNNEDSIHVILGSLYAQQIIITSEIIKYVKSLSEREYRRKANYSKDYLIDLYLLLENHNRRLLGKDLLSVNGNNGYSSSSSSASINQNADAFEFRPIPNPIASNTKPENDPIHLGNIVQIYWDGDDAWYKGYVVEFNAEKNSIKVIYTDGEVKWEHLKNLKYRIILKHPKVSRTLKDSVNGYTYVISKIDGSIVKYKTDVSAAASSAAAAGPVIEAEKPIKHTSSKKRSSSSMDLQSSADKRHRETEATKTPASIFFSDQALASTGNLAANKHAVDLTYEEDAQTKELQLIVSALETKKNELEKEQAMLDAKKREAEQKILARKQLLEENLRNEMQAMLVNVEQELLAAFSSIETANTSFKNASEKIEMLTARAAMQPFSPATRDFLNQKFQTSIGDLNSESHVCYAARSMLLSRLDKLGLSILSCKNVLNPIDQGSKSKSDLNNQEVASSKLKL